MKSQTKPTALRFDELDGLRAFAVVATMIAHSGLTIFPAAVIGVDVFFVMSGFLITHLLLREFGQFGRVGLIAFYKRRAIRLLPALLTMLLIVDTAALLWAKPSLRTADIYTTFRAVTYSVNWMTTWAGSFAQLWTLSIEEQFYFAWPIVLIVALHLWPNRRTEGAVILAVLSLADLAYQASAYHFGWFSIARIIDGTDLHSHGLLLGSSVAFWLTRKDGGIREISRSGSRLSAGLAGSALISVFCSANSRGIILDIGYPLVIISSALLIIWVVSGNVGRLGSFLRVAPIVYLGRLSYSLYLWHLAIYFAMDQTKWWPDHPYLIWPAKIIFPFLAAATSYHFVETPFAKWAKQHTFRPAHRVSKSTTLF